MKPFKLVKKDSVTFDGHLITRVEGLLGTSMTYGIRRQTADPGMLIFSTEVFGTRWALELDLDGEAVIKLTQTQENGEVTVEVFPVVGTRFDKTPVPLPRMKGDLSIPERLDFEMPGRTKLPGDDEARGIMVEVHFFNDLPIAQGG